MLVTVFGGSGFLGRHVVRALAKRGHRVRVAVRRPDLAGHLQPLGMPGQIMAVQANLRYPESVSRAIKGADAVVNLVGILAEGGRQSFDAVQAAGAAAIAKATAEEGLTRLVHVSAIGADLASEANYARTKAVGENAVLDSVPDAVILRPSIVFGPEDGFFNRFAGLAKMLPALPLIGGGQTRFQPVYVGDVAEAVARGVEGKLRAGETYELGGPAVRTFEELLRLTLKEIGKKRLLLPIPWPIAKLQGALFQILPNPLLTVDQVTLLKTDNVVSADAIEEGRTLSDMGIVATPLESVLPTYLWRFRTGGQFATAQR